MRKIGISIFFLGVVLQGTAQVPKVHSNIGKDEELFYEKEGEKLYALPEEGQSLQRFLDAPSGTDGGIAFDFGGELNGTLYYGLISEQGKFHFPVFFKREGRIEDGKARIPVREAFSGKYDMTGWQERGKGTIGYRVLNSSGEMLYQGRVNFREEGGSFRCGPTMVDGPTVNELTSSSVTLAYFTDRDVKTEAMVRPAELSPDMEGGVDLVQEREARTRHEIELDRLEADTEYRYEIRYGKERTETGTFKTPPEPGARDPFTFAYTSDSRAGKGGGERAFYGANFYIMRKMGALCRAKDAAFLQFTGDLINGYSNSPEDQRLQYANWRRAVEPFWRYMPIYATMGNHEALVHAFPNEEGEYPISVDRFPYEDESAESLFAERFTNFENGPESEDGASYDPDPDQKDFPSYKENVYSYVHDNVAMIVLNPDYWYAPSLATESGTSGGLHGYIMDRQLEWMKGELEDYEADEAIDHIFVTLHTPFFPNGGHSHDDMWYSGDNTPRPHVDGDPVEYGIIERRDQLLDAIVNESEKTRAILTGDEHNYNKLRIGPGMPRYPEGYEPDTLALEREIWQINNGAAGAPYYAQEELPWSDRVSSFSTKNVLTLFHVDGEQVRMEAIDPRTYEVVDEVLIHE